MGHDMTPETLREAANETAESWGDDDPNVVLMRAAADAWEADLLAKDNVECVLDAAKEHIDGLELRLEEADVAMLDAAVKLRDYETSDDELDKVADRLAALAGEKP